MIQIDSLEELEHEAQREGKRISDVVIRWQAEKKECAPEAVLEEMRHHYLIMKEAAEKGSGEHVVSASGLTGKDGYRMWNYIRSGETLSGGILPAALARALSVIGWNASMGRIVAAPTAGSCGILPAALVTMELERHISEENCVRGMFTASAVGMVIAKKASIAGAQGGCQAECGAASAMAAAALTELKGGIPHQVVQAAAIALKSVLGLVCDPVAGLVEIPCIKRNAAGTATAFMAAELALAGIESAIPADEVIMAMKAVGDTMPVALKETAEGGLAATPTGRRLCRETLKTREIL